MTVLRHEGGFVNDPRDAGGATNYGISLRWLKTIGDLDGDGFLDGDLDRDGDVDWQDITKMTVEQAKGYYRKHWWDAFRYDRIDSQRLATKVFDLAVNMGPRRAHRVVQQACNTLIKLTRLPETGYLGPLTCGALNALNEGEVYRAICDQAAAYYRSLNRPEYVSGWLKRAYA